MAKRILVADDNESIRSILAMTLKFKGYEIVEAVDGMAAFEALRAGAFDLVITDIDMPRLSGTGLVDKIRGELGNASLPIIVCTAEPRVDKQLLASKGVSAILAKPVSPADLLTRVAGIIG